MQYLVQPYEQEIGNDYAYTYAQMEDWVTQMESHRPIQKWAIISQIHKLCNES